ncbi:hypothetical protein HYPSUDRAFT_80093 [Hypholoma sublateritium FD-334 SS-4]|uniref:Ecp2 effector protein domain-containing protein n=1 Tax=Hypholoma sublateritium (strain FD-334 SS-4) TaxID=945553 RepID=A0A0D2LZN8_HYPSF|nr:hypothetical protein HYPSUDRAFT_80093 [Hypholoma sublateritium FD-334 SS-4]
MKFSSSLLAALSFASIAVCSVPVSRTTSCKASDRVVVKSRNVTSSDGHEIQIATKACSADVIKATRDLEKRQVINVDVDGSRFTCVTGEGVGPAPADCQVIISFLQTNFVDIDSQASFSVAPGFAEVITAGTCEWAWINTEPSGGFTLGYDFLNFFDLGFDLESCITNGDSGGIATPIFSGNDLVVDWQFEHFRYNTVSARDESSWIRLFSVWCGTT